MNSIKGFYRVQKINYVPIKGDQFFKLGVYYLIAMHYTKEN